jgi:uncharacterized membrane protein
MRDLTDWIDTGGGHIVVALFIFLVGVGLVVRHVPEGKEVMIGALASLWTALRVGKQQGQKKG